MKISNPHLAKAGNGAPFSGEAALRDAVDHLLQLPTPPDVVIVTGDLAYQGRTEEYARVRDVLRALTMPVYVVPGNHDDRAQCSVRKATRRWGRSCSTWSTEGRSRLLILAYLR